MHQINLNGFNSIAQPRRRGIFFFFTTVPSTANVSRYLSEINVINIGFINGDNPYYPYATYDEEGSLKAFTKAACAKYPGRGTPALFIGTVAPDSERFCFLAIYSTSDVSSGLPRYSYGRFIGYAGSYTSTGDFGTGGFTWYYHRLT